jgi:2-polyprenyl-6-methoxyphenol hydroxylase-like FAD-dependent oxidoreductase
MGLGMKEQSGKNVLVVGGGIGGLSAAIALQLKGFSVKVIEKQADIHSSVYGVGIIQPANALRALDVIGCATACLDAGFPASVWGSMYDVDGRFLHDMPGARIEGSNLPPLNGLTRPKLHEILTRRALEVGTDIVYSTTFTDLRELDNGIEVDLTSGGTETFELVVGADGVRSQVRRYVLGDELQPQYIGQSAFRVNIPRLPEIDRIILQVSREGVVGFVPIGKELAYLFFNAQMEKDTHPSDEELPELLRSHLAPFGGLAARVRDELITSDSVIVLRPEEALIAPRPWHHGRLVLVGDAVHAITPHLGQGAAQAIEDGVVLADSLSTIDDLDEALSSYADRRFERCKLIVETSLAIAESEMGRRPGFDPAAATNHVLAEMARPI